jgi:hypothetical protein
LGSSSAKLDLFFKREKLPRNDGESSFRKSEKRGLSGNSQIAAEGKFKTSTKSRTVNTGDNWNRQILGVNSFG